MTAKGNGMITSTANQKIKSLIKLRKNAKLRSEKKVYLVEGVRMFTEVPLEYLLEVWVSETFTKKHGELLKKIPESVPVEILTDTVFVHVSDTKSPQGVLCVVRQKDYQVKEMLRSEAPLLIILDQLQDPGNLGTILRTAEAAGVTGVILSKDCVDIYNPKVIRSTMGSVYRVPFVYVEDLPAVLDSLKDYGITAYAAHLEGKNRYDQECYRKGTAFLIGNEGNGLREEVAERADIRIRIPMEGQVESLNAAIAAAVLMFEAGRQRREV